MYKRFQSKKYKPKMHGRVGPRSHGNKVNFGPWWVFGKIYSKYRAQKLCKADQWPQNPSRSRYECHNKKSKTHNSSLPSIVGGYTTHGVIGRKSNKISKKYNRAKEKMRLKNVTTR